MALEGSFNTPLGDIPKKTALLIAGGAGLIIVVVWYRSKKNSTDVSATGQPTEINPATGYVYGSPEDAAALANQNAYNFPSGSVGSGGGGAYVGSTPGSFTSNAQWAQFVEQYMTSNGIVQGDAAIAALGSAIGKYLTGQPLTTEAQNYVQQAIAFGGPVPVAGPSGFPPSMNTTPASGGGGTDTLVVTVTEGTALASFLNTMNSRYAGLNLTEAKLRELNPGLNIILANRNGYVSDTNPPNGSEVLTINTDAPTQQVRIR